MPRTPGRFPARTFAQATTLQADTAPPVAPPTFDRVCVTPTTGITTTITISPR